MSELKEKFVSDDGISTVPDAITPAGGEIKPRRGDVKKAVDPKAGTVPKPPMAEENDLDEETLEFVDSMLDEGHDLDDIIDALVEEELEEGSIKGSGADRKAQLKKAYRAGEADTRDFNRPGGMPSRKPKGDSDAGIKKAYQAGRGSSDGGSAAKGTARSRAADSLRGTEHGKSKPSVSIFGNTGKTHYKTQTHAAKMYGMKKNPKRLPESFDEEIVSIDESIQSMFEGMDLSEEFKSKVTLVFEAAVNETVNARVNEATAALEEEFEERLTDSVEEAMDEVVENLDSYLDYVVAEWMKENEVAIEAGIKVEMAESLMDGLRELFAEHNIDVDDETLDVVAGLEAQSAELEEAANEAINENIELRKEIAALKAEKVFEQVSEGLTVSQKERLKVLSEKLDVDDLEDYSSDLTTLKESFFKTKKTQVINEDAEDEVLTEETAVKKPASQYATVNAIVEALNKKTAK